MTKEKSTYEELRDRTSNDTSANYAEENEVPTSKVLRSFGEETTVVEKELAFQPKAELFNGICRGTIESVTLADYTYPEQDANGMESNFEYRGKRVYNVDVKFAQDPTTNDGEHRVIHYKSSLVSRYTKDGKANKSYNGLVQEEYFHVRHILNAMGITEKTPLKVYEDIDESVAEWNRFIHNVYDILTDELPKFAGKLFYIRVVADFTTRGYFRLPMYVGKGFLELITDPDKAPLLELEPGDNITLLKKEDAPKGKTGTQSVPEVPNLDGLKPDVQALLALATSGKK
jgi:hypothetical protein